MPIKNIEGKLGSFENPVKVDNFKDLWNVKFGNFVKIGEDVVMVSNELDREIESNLHTITAAYTIKVQKGEATRSLYAFNSESFKPRIQRTYQRGDDKYSFYMGMFKENGGRLIE